jgi:hypothetical protein
VITPFIGGLVPTKSMGRLRIGGGSSNPTVFEGEMKTAGAFGARLGYWAGERWGLEGAYFFSSSDLRTTDGPFAETFDAEVQAGSLKMFYQATSQNTGTDLLISGGVAAVRHSGQAFLLTEGQLDLGGTIGAGLHVVMSDLMTFRLDADLLLYPWSAGQAGFGTQLQADYLMTIGLGFRLAR